MTNRELVEQLWIDLYNRDFDAVGAAFADDGEYTDMPTPADDVARGPVQIAARLRLGLEPLAGISHDIGKLVRWWDYWDLATLMSSAPAWWVEHIMNESARLGLREA